MSKVTEQDFVDYVNDLDADDVLDLIKDYDRYELLTHNARDSSIDAERDRFKETDCYRCDECREYFTDIEDLNEDDLCSDCRDDEETQQEHSEGVVDGE